MLTLDDFDFSGKTVLVRVDLNCPFDEKTGKIEKSERVVAHAKTIKELSEKGARTVVLAHQGRKGEPDFIHLSQHATMLEEEIGSPVLFVKDVCGAGAKSAITNCENGQVVLLDNVRFLDDETKFEKTLKAQIVDALSGLYDYFVLDAFSVAHRAHASVVGLREKPVVAGRVLQSELEALSRFKDPQRPFVAVFGGAKPDDSIGILEMWLAEGKLDKALCGGVLGSLFILASGRELGGSLAYLKSKKSLDFLPKARDLLDNYGEQILFPSDVVLAGSDGAGGTSTISIESLPSEGSIVDIGAETISAFTGQIEEAKTILVNGPMGVYEKPESAEGTRKILTAVSSFDAFSLVGGGHTISAVDKFGLGRENFGYVSLSGKALIEYLSGSILPGVELVEAAGKANI